MRFPGGILAFLAAALTLPRALPGQAPRGFTDCDLSSLTSAGLFVRGSADPWGRLTPAPEDRSGAAQRRAPARRRGRPAAVDSTPGISLDSGLLRGPFVVPERTPPRTGIGVVDFTSERIPSPPPRPLLEYAWPCTTAPTR